MRLKRKRFGLLVRRQNAQVNRRILRVRRNFHLGHTHQARNARVAEPLGNRLADRFPDHTSHFLLSSGCHGNVVLYSALQGPGHFNDFVRFEFIVDFNVVKIGDLDAAFKTRFDFADIILKVPERFDRAFVPDDDIVANQPQFGILG